MVIGPDPGPIGRVVHQRTPSRRSFRRSSAAARAQLGQEPVDHGQAQVRAACLAGHRVAGRRVAVAALSRTWFRRTSRLRRPRTQQCLLERRVFLAGVDAEMQVQSVDSAIPVTIGVPATDRQLLRPERTRRRAILGICCPERTVWPQTGLSAVTSGPFVVCEHQIAPDKASAMQPHRCPAGSARAEVAQRMLRRRAPSGCMHPRPYQGGRGRIARMPLTRITSTVKP